MKRAIVIFLFATAAFADRWSTDDRFKLVGVSDPQLSPDGKQVAIVVSRANLKDNRNETEIVAVDVATGATRPLTFERRGVASPRWSPDGERMAFLANATAERDAKRQIWIMTTRGGDARRITDAANGVQQIAWSPDGSRIAYVTADEVEKKTSDLEKHNRSFEVDDDNYLFSAAPTPSHLWLVSPDGGAARRVTSGAWSLPVARPPGPAPSPVSWSPDGKSIAITMRDTPHEKTPDSGHVAVVDVATGNVRRLTDRVQEETQPVFSPDGKSIAYWHPRGGQRGSANAIWIAPAAGGNGTEVTKNLDRNIYRSIWLPDGKAFLTASHDETTTAYYFVEIETGAFRRLELGEVEPAHGYWPDASVARNGTIAFTGTTPSHPRELWVMSSVDAKPRQLTHFNDWVSSKDLGRAQRITWTFEGMHQDGVVITPPGYDASKAYPLVLYIHGGPRSASTTGFSSITQSFAAQDWIVFMPNYRGSDNFGNAYTRAINEDAGAGPGRDVMAGIDAVKKRFKIDENRIGVGGWSYGGYMTSWMIGHYPIFKAAVSGAAVNNLVAQYTFGDGGLGRRITWGSPYGTPESLKKYVEMSPITYASKIRTPTLIMCNTGDVRVPITQSYEMYRALRDNGVPTKFIAYPVGGHSAEDPVHAADVERRYIDWFSRYLTAANTPRAATRAEVAAYVDRAAALVAKNGASCEAFASPAWLSGDWYVFVFGPDRKALCNPSQPSFVGKSASEIVDANGKRTGDLLVTTALGANGRGWVDYVWPRPGEKTPVSKSAYVVSVTGPDGKRYVVGSGGYELK
jgi:dipeptidyl aminopeptidase/acylaminoacyl peptidase